MKATNFTCAPRRVLPLDMCLPLLGAEIQRKGKLLTWFSSNLESGTRRWAAIYKYQRRFYAQSTDAGQTGLYRKLYGAFGVAISNVDISSLKIGGISMLAESFIQLLRKELKAAKYEILGLNLERVEAFAKKMFSGGHIENKQGEDGIHDEFIDHQEIANAGGAIFKLWPGENNEEWEDNFLNLLNEHGRCVYRNSWESGGQAGGAECINEFLGRYWPDTTMDGLSGPYRSFNEVFENENQPFRYVTSAVEEIWCRKMSIEELLPRLILDDPFDPGFTVKINDKPYKLSEDSRLIPVQ
jgi:hypothetical protein